MTAPANFYDLLQVHPAAPLDLVSAAYWRLTNLVQQVGDGNGTTQLALHHLTRAYRVVSDPSARAQYDRHIGLGRVPDAPKVPRRRRGGLFAGSKRPLMNGVDYYEVLRVHPTADPLIVLQGYDVMRNIYIRLVRSGKAPFELLEALEDAYEVISNADTREEYHVKHGLPSKIGPVVLEFVQNQPRQPAAQVAPAATATLEDQTQTHASAVAVAEPVPAEEEPGVAEVLETAVELPMDEDTAAAAELTEEVSVEEEVKPAIEVVEETAVESIPEPPVEVGPNRTLDLPAEPEAPEPPAADKGSRTSLASLIGRSLSGMTQRKPSVPAPKRSTSEVLLRTPQGPTPEEEEAVLARLHAGRGAAQNEETFTGTAYLTLSHEPSGARDFVIDRSPMLLGADVQCDIPLPGMAPHEARLAFREGQFILFSLTDVRGIELHGEHVAWAVLENGISVGVGPYTLRFRVESR